MTTTIDGPSDSSVTFSLAELVKLEQDRIQEERARDARALALQAERTRDEAERALAAEAERRAREEEARRASALRDAEAIARIEGRERALGEVARIEAEARARIALEEAGRAHELAMLRARLERSAVRGRAVLAALLAVSVAGAVVTTLVGRARAARLEANVATLEHRTVALETERDQAHADADRATRAEREASAREVAARRALEDALAAARAGAPTTVGAPPTAGAAPGGKTDRGSPPLKDAPVDTGKKCSNPRDPLCGLDGRSL